MKCHVFKHHKLEEKNPKHAECKATIRLIFPLEGKIAMLIKHYHFNIHQLPKLVGKLTPYLPPKPLIIQETVYFKCRNILGTKHQTCHEEYCEEVNLMLWDASFE